MKKIILFALFLFLMNSQVVGQFVPNKLYSIISENFRIEDLSDSSALYTFHFKFVIRNKKLRNFDVYPSEYSKYFKVDAFSDKGVTFPIKRRNATLILPVVYTVVSKETSLPYAIRISNTKINERTIFNLFSLENQNKKYIYLKPYMPTYSTIIYDYHGLNELLF